MNLKRRLDSLESTWIEAQIDKLQAHFRSLSRADLDLIIEIADGQKAGGFAREYSASEVGMFNNHCDFLAAIPAAAHEESTRRNVKELLATGKATRAEIDEILGSGL